jgi:hypothetical protein
MVVNFIITRRCRHSFVVSILHEFLLEAAGVWSSTGKGYLRTMAVVVTVVLRRSHLDRGGEHHHPLLVIVVRASEATVAFADGRLCGNFHHAPAPSTVPTWRVGRLSSGQTLGAPNLRLMVLLLLILPGNGERGMCLTRGVASTTTLLPPAPHHRDMPACPLPGYTKGGPESRGKYLSIQERRHPPATPLPPPLSGSWDLKRFAKTKEKKDSKDGD